MNVRSLSYSRSNHWYYVVGFAVLMGLALGILSACAGKFTEPWKDADVSSRNDGPAVIGTMPDGFNNWAFKCNGPVGVYTLYHADAGYGGLATVKDDPNCRSSR